jgi:hypothetical protein
VLGVNGDTPDAVRHYVNASLAKYSGVRMKVDGEAVSDIDDFRTHTPGLFTLDMPGRNILGLPAGPAQLFIGGWFVMLKGFDEGTHTVYTHDILDDGTVASVTFHLTAI